MSIQPTPAALFAERVGSGPPVLFLHGGLGWDHSYLQRWLEPLSTQATCIFVDLRGNGGSPAGVPWDEIDHALLVDDVIALCRELGHERVVLFGHSYGAFLALELALRQPDCLKGLILCSAAPALDYMDDALARLRARATPEQLASVMALLSAALRDDEEMRSLTEGALPAYLHDPGWPPVAELVGDMRYNAAAFSHGLSRCLPRFDVRDRLGEISVPTLLLGGRSDWVTPPEPGVERLHRGIRASELHVFENSGHFPFAEEQAAFLAVMRRWLAELETGSDPGGA